MRDSLGGAQLTMTTRALITISVVVAAFAWSQSPLTKSDFAIARLRPGLSAATVRRTLGRPDSVHPARSETGKCYDEWFYGGLTVGVLDTTLYNFTLRDRSHATARGLRVGDSLAKAERFYGEPTQKAPYWEYAVASKPDLRLIITYHDVRIQAIDLGQYTNCE
jgi:hypothetical protein